MDLKNKEQVKKLIKGCKRGDRKSQRVLYEALYPKMLGVCMRYSSDPSEAKDLVQDGFIKVFQKIKSFNYKGSLEGWVRRLIVNNSIDHIRKSRQMRYNYEEESNLLNMKDETPEIQEDKKLIRLKAEAIVKLIQELSPAYRTVLNLYVVEDMSHKEISEQLGISEGTSKSNLSKAKVKLRELYNEQFEQYDRENKI
jgi:RNA polymerase sigma-70 factor (ECF subfamily)